MNRILVSGKNGQLGWKLQSALAPLGEVIALGREEMDVADPDAIRSTMRACASSIIVNAAAFTAVDKAEEDVDLAMEVNGIAPGIMAEEARRLDALLVHYSTDYVYDGTKETPYKLAGDEAIAYLRVQQRLRPFGTLNT